MIQYAYMGTRKRSLSRERDATDHPGSNFRKSATGERKSSMLSRSEKVASKSDVSCKDMRVTSEAICEALQGLDCCETDSIYHIEKGCSIKFLLLMLFKCNHNIDLY